MNDILGRPLLDALVSDHSGLVITLCGALGCPGSDATTIDEILADLARLTAPLEHVALTATEEIPIPPVMTSMTEKPLAQMPGNASEQPPDPTIERLTIADAGHMLELAILPKPGPFTLEAQRLANFSGIKDAGSLVAMIGQRLRQTVFVEMSGLSSHSVSRAQGIGRRLPRFMTTQIAAKGHVPSRHAHVANMRV